MFEWTMTALVCTSENSKQLESFLKFYWLKSAPWKCLQVYSLQLVTDRVWNNAKILSFADEKIRFLSTCFFIFVYSVLFQFSALMSETAFSQGFFICTWYLFDVSIWILLFPVIIRLYLGRGTKMFLITWTPDQWMMPSTLKHFLVTRKFVLWSVAENQTLFRINHTLVRLFRSPLCKLLS